MQARSWMAGCGLAALIFASFASAPRAADNPAPQKVELDLRIAGLGPKGCEIEIKPAYPGCRFTPVKERVSAQGVALVKLNDVRTISADRDCAFAITIREPGQPVRTIKRGLRLSAGSKPNSASSLVCFINSPSSLARAEQGRIRR